MSEGAWSVTAEASCCGMYSEIPLPLKRWSCSIAENLPCRLGEDCMDYLFGSSSQDHTKIGAGVL